MRGLDEIRKTNDDPHGRRTDEHFGARDHRDHEAKAHASGYVPGRGGYGETFASLREASRRGTETINDILFTALLLDVLASAEVKEPEHQERIHSALDAEPPFFKFWQRLNDALAANGKPEAGYADAKRAFTGGATPVGALTFIGKEWDGLRAVPAEPVKYLGGTRPVYHGEHREVTGNGTVWHKVRDDNGLPIAYKLPEAALVAAKEANRKAIDKAFH